MTKKIKSILIFSVLLSMLVMPAGNMGVAHVSAGGYCDWIQYVADVTIPDGLPVDPGIPLSKTWRLKNIGTCWWTKDYKLVFVGGEQMGGLSAVNLPKGVAPGQTIDLTIGLTAPLTPGFYNGYWELQNPAGGLFGIGPTASKPFFIEIEVVSKAAPVFDFVANAPLSIWGSEASGRRPFPGVYGDPDGYVQTVDHPIFENGIQSNLPGILMAPPAEYNEHIYGIFPAYEVKAGDRFQALIGCEYGAKDCEVTFVLQYQNPEGGSGRTYWSKVKSYKNSFTKVNLSLNPLAGQKVSFVFLIRPNGTSTGDKAMWVNPVIVNSFIPGPAIPTITPQPVVTAVPTVSTLPPTTGCDRAYFISDVSVPDGAVFTPGQTFTKTWKLRNTGKCTWTTGYSLVFSTGDQMSGLSSINLPFAVAPRQEIDLSVNLTAPNNVGNYRGYWLLKNASGGVFGIGTLGNKPFWLSIGVSGSLPSTSGNGYDFAAHACEAQWTSGAGTLACPDTSPTKGTIQIVNNPRLENNTIDSRSALLTVPENVYNGYIQGVFPPFTVQSGDRFKSLVNCEYLQRDCYAVFRLDYQIENGPIQNLWAFGERYEGLTYQADIDLSLLAGKNVKFILRVNANGSPAGDRAMWVAPGIVRSGGIVLVNTPTATVPPLAAPASASTLTFTPVPVIVPSETPTPVFTATVPPPVNTGQQTYTNQRYGFKFTYPANSVLGASQDTYARINLPFNSGTNLVEKYMEVVVVNDLSPCHTTSFTNPPSSSVNGTINGIIFLAETGTDSALGNIYDWKVFSALHNNACISMNFVLHSANNGAPQFDKTAESSIIDSIMSTFGWTP